MPKFKAIFLIIILAVFAFAAYIYFYPSNNFLNIKNNSLLSNLSIGKPEQDSQKLSQIFTQSILAEYKYYDKGRNAYIVDSKENKEYVIYINENTKVTQTKPNFDSTGRFLGGTSKEVNVQDLSNLLISNRNILIQYKNTNINKNEIKADSFTVLSN
jgi:hypothetical protein